MIHTFNADHVSETNVTQDVWSYTGWDIYNQAGKKPDACLLPKQRQLE